MINTNHLITDDQMVDEISSSNVIHDNYTILDIKEIKIISKKSLGDDVIETEKTKKENLRKENVLVKKETAKKEKSFYINQKELFNEIIISKDQGKMTKRLEELIILLGQRTIQKMVYYNQQDKQDCLQEGLLALYKNWDKFDPYRSTITNPDGTIKPNPSLAFAYYTEIFKRGIARGYNELHGKKDKDNNKRIKFISIEGSNNGDGLFGF